mgnify:CR=1 FL=1
MISACINNAKSVEEAESLEVLRGPLEDRTVTISRLNSTLTYPCNFMLIASMNPCPCGHLGNAALSCSRAPRCAEAYQNKISGPLLDRIDLHVDVDAVNPWEMTTDTGPRETSAAIRTRVVAARNRQIARQGMVNAHLDGADLDRHASMSDELMSFLNAAAEKMGLSARGYNRIRRLARTIADLRASDAIEMSDLAEALSYRPINRGKYGVKLY